MQPDQRHPGESAPANAWGVTTAAGTQVTARPSECGSRRRIGSAQIFLGSDEIEIDHDGALYRLRITSLGKLILTK